ncbi:MAG TPA: IS200/IS605 family transposase [Chlamydiales bacterium]|nr:IS200/IS605 family transposase [Chlamydiales bacterium]
MTFPKKTIQYIIWAVKKSIDNIRRGRSCVFLMHVHLVFVAKYRKSIFTKAILKELSEIFHSVCQDFEANLVEFEGEKDHVHLLVNYPPKVSVSKLANSLKGVSFRLLRKNQYPTIQRAFWKGVLWSPSYFSSSCGGAPISVIRNYIETQNKPE